MNRFAALLDRLAYEPRRNAKIRLMADYFRHTPDPERGWALAAMTGSLSFSNAKPGLIRGLIAERTYPVLFGLSWDYVGDLSETVALMWPKRPPAGEAGLGHNNPPPSVPTLAEVIEGLSSTRKVELPGLVSDWPRRASLFSPQPDCREHEDHGADHRTDQQRERARREHA